MRVKEISILWFGRVKSETLQLNLMNCSLEEVEIIFIETKHILFPFTNDIKWSIRFKGRFWGEFLGEVDREVKISSFFTVDWSIWWFPASQLEESQITVTATPPRGHSNFIEINYISTTIHQKARLVARSALFTKHYFYRFIIRKAIRPQSQNIVKNCVIGAIRLFDK